MTAKHDSALRSEQPGDAPEGGAEGAGGRSEQPPPRMGALEDLLGFQLRLAQDASFRAFARSTGFRGIKPGRYAALMVIRNNPGMTQTALSRAISRDKSSVSPLIKDLEKRGLVKRVTSPTDRRSVALTLTPAGDAVLQRLDQNARTHDRRLDEIAGADRDVIFRFLKAVVDTVN